MTPKQIKRIKDKYFSLLAWSYLSGRRTESPIQILKKMVFEIKAQSNVYKNWENKSVCMTYRNYLFNSPSEEGAIELFLAETKKTKEDFRYIKAIQKIV